MNSRRYENEEDLMDKYERTEITCRIIIASVDTDTMKKEIYDYLYGHRIGIDEIEIKTKELGIEQ